MSQERGGREPQPPQPTGLEQVCTYLADTVVPVLPTTLREPMARGMGYIPGAVDASLRIIFPRDPRATVAQLGRLTASGRGGVSASTSC